MRDEYNISELNPRKNPYANRLKKQITINIDGGTIDYFKSLADAKGIPYQTLINLYLRDCADNHRQPVPMPAPPTAPADGYTAQTSISDRQRCPVHRQERSFHCRTHP